MNDASKTTICIPGEIMRRIVRLRDLGVRVNVNLAARDGIEREVQRMEERFRSVLNPTTDADRVRKALAGESMSVADADRLMTLPGAPDRESQP